MISNQDYIEIKKMFKKSISIHRIIPFLVILLVLNAQKMSPTLLSLRSNPLVSHKSDDHSKIIFNGPTENVMLKLNIKFDPTLKHFRIQEIEQTDCSGETEQEIVTVVKTETKTVNQQKKEVKSSEGWKQNQNTLKVVSKPNVLTSNLVQPVLTGKPMVLNTPKVAQPQVANKVVTSQTTIKKAEKLEQAKPQISSSSKNQEVKIQKLDQDSKVKSSFIQTNTKGNQMKPKVENLALVEKQVIVGANPKTWGIVNSLPIKVAQEKTSGETTKNTPLKTSGQKVNENKKLISELSKAPKAHSEGTQSQEVKVSLVQNEGSTNNSGPTASKRPSKANLSSQSQNQGQATPTESSSVASSQPTKASSWKIF